MPKSSIFVSLDQRILFLMVWESFRCILANCRRAAMCLLLRSGFHLATLPYWPDCWIAAEMVVLLEGSPLSTKERWSYDRVTIGFLVTSLTKALLPRSLSLDGRPALGRVLVVLNFFHLRMMEVTLLIGTFKAAEIFLYPSPDLFLKTILSRRSTDNSFEPSEPCRGDVYLLFHCVNCTGFCNLHINRNWKILIPKLRPLCLI